MARPVVGIIGNHYLLNDQYPTHAGGTMNSEAIAKVSNCVPLIVPSNPDYVGVEELLETWPDRKAQLIDIREDNERRRDGAIPGSMHLPYGQFSSYCEASGPLRLLGENSRLLLYCAVGERSTLAVEIADEHGIQNIVHLPGGFREWKAEGGAVENIA